MDEQDRREQRIADWTFDIPIWGGIIASLILGTVMVIRLLLT